MKYTAVVIALLFTGIVKGQTEQGTILPGGSISFQTTEGSTIFTFNPSLGYFVKNNLAIGTSLTLTSEANQTIWGIGPFIRGYFGKNPKGKPFIGASALI